MPSSPRSVPHNRRSLLIMASAIACLLTLGPLGCQRALQTSRDMAATASPPAANVVKAEQPITIDGELDDPVWRRAPTYPLMIPEQGDRPDPTGEPRQPGKVQFAVNDQYLVLAVSMEDQDIVQEATADQEHHYRTGDLAELFLKPADATWYWELYVTPNGLKTAFFFPGRGRRNLPSNLSPIEGMTVAAQVQGTLGNWHDTDTGWTAEMAIPLQVFADAGIPLNGDEPWRVLVGRYNFGRELPEVELSAFPELRVVNFHLYEQWAPLQLPRSSD